MLQREWVSETDENFCFFQIYVVAVVVVVVSFPTEAADVADAVDANVVGKFWCCCWEKSNRTQWFLYTQRVKNNIMTGLHKWFYANLTAVERE